MKRLKLLGAVALLGVLACEEATPPPPVGSIVGQVAIEGTGIDGVSVNLSNGNSTTTSGGGNYRFDNVEGGAYTVTISGYPSDATFDATSAAATISTAGQSVTVNFSGAYIRTASVMGSVTVENMGLGGVTVALSGMSNATATTDGNGQYAFTGLRMGSYSVEISGFDSDEIGFSNTSSAVTVAVGESKIVSFDGTYLRTAGIMGRVSVEGEGLEGVTVSLSGGPDGVDETAMTDAAGQYSFARLRAGDYAVGISGYDTDDYEFEVTSQSVTVALGETANVPFEGVLLRTSGISGRVSVEGIGLEGVMVTLSGMDMEDMTAMTDAGGLYAFAGLAAGDYTVAIALSDEQMAAYVFDMTSMDVTVGDDMTEIVNFEATHAATAMITVQLFVDEGTKNDMMDEGEPAFPTAAMLQMVADLGLPLALPISLAGPGVLDMQQGMAMPDGSVVFSGLKAGNYQVLVSDIPAEVLAALPPALAAVLQDYAYGGPATGYPIALGVGEELSQYAPVDITHTTVNVAVTLKGGDHRGMGVAGATVNLYADAMGETKISSGTTMMNEEGHAYTSIRFARAGTAGNTVHMSVSSDDYWVDPTAGTQAVMWNAMSPVHPAPDADPPAVLNDANILNLTVDVTVSGATVDRGDYGGGKPLGGWVIGVMQGSDPTALEAVEGDDVPTMLDSAGMASFARTLMPTDLPATYHFGVAPDQPNALDGGEKYEGTPVSYTHTGLSLAGTMDAGAIEVAYTTQTLKVYVYHERDQVRGYTGNVLGGDARVSGMLDVGIRYIADNGRSRAFANDVWRKTSSTFSDSRGVVTFRGVPADADVIAVADEVAQDPDDEDYQPIMLLDPDELAAYTDEDGATGGMFGANGGTHHTVELCPLQATDPTGQDHGECGSFAFVETYAVHGQAWKNDVIMNAANDGFTERGLRAVPGTTVDLDPVAGKNLAGESESFTALEKPVRTRGENVAGTSILDETKQFNFGRMAAGVYKVTVPKGWTAKIGTPDDATGSAAVTFNPLAGDAQIDVTPTTGILYGRVNGSDNFPLDSTTVDVNGMSTETDEFGRYIVDGFAHRTGANNSRTNPDWRRQRIVVVTASRGGFDAVADTMLFNPTVNTPTEYNIDLAGTAQTATVSGRVTAFGSDDPIAGVEIRVDGVAPINKNAKSVRTLPANDIYVTGADGTYSINVPAKGVGQTSRISAHRAGMTFSPAHLDLSTPSGSSISGINFQGVANSTINGRVQAPGGGPLSGVKVTATAVGASAAADEATTGATGTFSLSVPAGTYDVAASKDGYTFTCPGTPANCRITVGLGQTRSFGDFTSALVVTPPANNPPVFSSSSTFEAAENQRDAGTVVAADPDAGDGAPSYAISGGADATMLSIDAASGELTFDAAPDFEAPGSADGDNDYHIEVEATSGTAGRMMSATQAITISVTDVDERIPQVTLVLDPASITENGGVSRITATVDPVSDAAFDVTVSAAAVTPAVAGDFILSNNMTLSFAANAASSTGAVSITAVDNSDYADDKTVRVSGSVSSTDVMAPADVDLMIEEDDEKPPAEATLSALSLGDVELSPNFASDQMAYTASVAYAVTQVTVTATASEGASRVITPDDDDDGMPGHQVDLVVGDNTITVVVTTEAGARSDYVIVVNRETANSPAAGDVTISGTARVGETLTADASGITDADGMTNATLSYQWISVAADDTETDVGMDQATYEVAASDAGNTLKVTVSFTDDRGTVESVTSDPTAAVDAANSPATGAVTISGTARVGETLTADASGIMDADGMTSATLSYQWSSVATDGTASDVGMDQTTYEVAAGDLGATIMVTVSFTDDRGFDESVESAATAAVDAANSPATGAVTISGTAQVGETLTADASGIMDADGMTNATLAYQWISVATADDDTETETDIAGATAETYTPVAGDEGNMLKVTVSFTDDRGSAESVTSEPTAAVAAKAADIVVSMEEVAVGEGDEATYTVSLATMPEADVTVTITDANRAGADLTDATTGVYSLSTVSRVFTSSNWNVAQDVTITAHEDDTNFDPHTVTLTHTAASSDTDYQSDPADAATGLTANVTVEISDDDVDGAGASVTDAETGGSALSTLTIEEGDADGGSYWIVLDAEPTDAVTISIAAGDDDADVTVTPSSLTFTTDNWDDAQKVTVTAPDNMVDAANGTATLAHTAEGGGYGDADLSGDNVTVTITEDDEAGLMVTDLGGRQVREGGSVSYSIALDTEPTGPVVVRVGSTQLGAAAAAQFNFDASNWQNAQSATITTPTDEDATDVAATITFTVLGYVDGDGTAVTEADQSFTVKDAQSSGVIISHTALSIAAGESDGYTVSLTKAPAAGETVTVTIASTGQISINPLTVELTTSNWEAGESVTLGPLAQASGSITVTNAVTSSADADDTEFDTATATDVTVTVTSN